MGLSGGYQIASFGHLVTAQTTNFRVHVNTPEVRLQSSILPTISAETSTGVPKFVTIM